jgi:Subtilase family
LCQAVEAAWKAGIVVVVAAGNDGRDTSVNGYGTITAPGNDPYVITVGAMNTMGTPDRSDDVMTTYSSKGPTAIDHIVKPDLVAPGNRVISLQAGQKATLVNSYQANRPLVAYYQGGNSGKLSDDYFILSATLGQLSNVGKHHDASFQRTLGEFCHVGFQHQHRAGCYEHNDSRGQIDIFRNALHHMSPTPQRHRKVRVRRRSARKKAPPLR